METGAVYYEPGPLHLTYFSGMAHRNPAWKCRGAGLSWLTAHCFAEDFFLPQPSSLLSIWTATSPQEDSLSLIPSSPNADRGL